MRGVYGSRELPLKCMFKIVIATFMVCLLGVVNCSIKGEKNKNKNSLPSIIDHDIRDKSNKFVEYCKR